MTGRVSSTPPSPCSPIIRWAHSWRAAWRMHLFVLHLTLPGPILSENKNKPIGVKPHFHISCFSVWMLLNVSWGREAHRRSPPPLSTSHLFLFLLVKYLLHGHSVSPSLSLSHTHTLSHTLSLFSFACSSICLGFSEANYISINTFMQILCHQG